MGDQTSKIKEETDRRRYRSAPTCTLTQVCPLIHMCIREHVLMHTNHNKETIKEEAWGRDSGVEQVEFHLL